MKTPLLYYCTHYLCFPTYVPVGHEALVAVPIVVEGLPAIAARGQQQIVQTFGATFEIEVVRRGGPLDLVLVTRTESCVSLP